MSTEELEQVLAELRRHRETFGGTPFVLLVERQADGGWRLLEYGLWDIGDLAAWIAVHKRNETQLKEAQG